MTILDGHHRMDAAEAVGRQTIPAYVIGLADYAGLLDDVFGGYAPPRLADLDDYIWVGGAPYSSRTEEAAGEDA